MNLEKDDVINQWPNNLYLASKYRSNICKYRSGRVSKIDKILYDEMLIDLGAHIPEHFHEAFSKLPSKERSICELAFKDYNSLVYIAKYFNMSVTRMGHILSRAIWKIKYYYDHCLDGPILETDSIDYLGLDMRSYNSLRRGGVRIIQNILDLEESGLLKIRNLGSSSLEHICQKLCEAGFELKRGIDVDEDHGISNTINISQVYDGPLSIMDRLRDLNNWEEISPGYYKYAITPNISYEIVIWRRGTNINNTNASLFRVISKDANNFIRDVGIEAGYLSDCLDLAVEDIAKE